MNASGQGDLVLRLHRQHEGSGQLKVHGLDGTRMGEAVKNRISLCFCFYRTALGLFPEDRPRNTVTSPVDESNRKHHQMESGSEHLEHLIQKYAGTGKCLTSVRVNVKPNVTV